MAIFIDFFKFPAELQNHIVEMINPKTLPAFARASKRSHALCQYLLGQYQRYARLDACRFADDGNIILFGDHEIFRGAGGLGKFMQLLIDILDDPTRAQFVLDVVVDSTRVLPHVVQPPKMKEMRKIISDKVAAMGLSDLGREDEIQLPKEHRDIFHYGTFHLLMDALLPLLPRVQQLVVQPMCTVVNEYHFWNMDVVQQRFPDAFGSLSKVVIDGIGLNEAGISQIVPLLALPMLECLIIKGITSIIEPDTEFDPITETRISHDRSRFKELRTRAPLRTLHVLRGSFLSTSLHDILSRTRPEQLESYAARFTDVSGVSTTLYRPMATIQMLATKAQKSLQSLSLLVGVNHLLRTLVKDVKDDDKFSANLYAFSDECNLKQFSALKHLHVDAHMLLRGAGILSRGYSVISSKQRSLYDRNLMSSLDKLAKEYPYLSKACCRLRSIHYTSHVHHTKSLT